MSAVTMHLALLCLTVLYVTHSLCWSPIPHTIHGYVEDPLYSSVDPGTALILTPHIKANGASARYLSEVRHQDFRGVPSYSGFITVNEVYNSNLFFWFFPSEEDYLRDPVIVWLQGGPGSSSLFGLFEENGPFILQNGHIERRRTSWTEQHSVIYIDNPVGTGFSFTRDPSGYATEQTQIGEQLHEFLQQFFDLFPELQRNKLFISGESYAGKYIPALAHTILQKKASARNVLNLHGLAIGNGFSDPYHQAEFGEYVYQLGLVDNSRKKLLQRFEGEVKEFIDQKNWVRAHKSFNITLEIFKRETGLANVYNYLADSDRIINQDSSISNYVQRNDVRLALHVGREAFDSSDVYKNLETDILQSVAHWVSEALSHYRVLIYTGQLDILVGYTSTLKYLENLKFSGMEDYADAFRRQWDVNGRIAGYAKQGGNLTEVLVRKAGHMVPKDRPEEAYALIYKFTRNMPL